MDYPLGRIVSPFDSRNWSLSEFMPGRTRRALSAMLAAESKTWIWPTSPLDQGNTSHCVGFSMAGFGIVEPVYDKFDNSHGHTFYRKCKLVDGIPNVEGSTILAAAKVLRSERMVDAYAFTYRADEMRWWVVNKSPMIVGTAWTSAMYVPDKNGIVYPVGTMVGGHAYLAYGYADGLFVCMNSWGRWGKNGTFFIREGDMQKLLEQDGEAIAAVEVERPVTPAPTPGPVSPKPKPKPNKDIPPWKRK